MSTPAVAFRPFTSYSVRFLSASAVVRKICVPRKIHCVELRQSPVQSVSRVSNTLSAQGVNHLIQMCLPSPRSALASAFRNLSARAWRSRKNTMAIAIRQTQIHPHTRTSVYIDDLSV